MVRSEDSRIYDDLMRFKPADLTPNGWAVRAGVSRTVWSDMRRHGNPSRRTLEKLLTVAGSSLAEFEALRVGNEVDQTSPSFSAVGEPDGRGWRGAALPPLDLYSSAATGVWKSTPVEGMEIRFDERIGEASRPASLASDRSAFAITVVGDSMWPRFRPGRRIAVSPRSPVSIGDDVLLVLRGEGAASALLAELIKRTGDGVDLRQFNPDTIFSVEAEEIEEIYKIAGEII